MTANNPLLNKFNTPYQTAPFKEIKNSHFKPAFKKAIEIAKKEIDAIAENEAQPTFKNTIESLAFSGMQLDVISNIFFNLNSAETNDEIQKIAQNISPKLTKFNNDVVLNKNLFKRVKEIFEQKEKLELTNEQHTLLEKTYKNFARNGANLNSEDQNKLRSFDAKLAKLKLKFGENVLAETNNYSLHITKKEDLAGLPNSAIEAAKLTAQQKDKKGWVFTLNYPSYIPFVTYAENRKLRKEITLAFGSKGFQNNQFNNEKIVKDIVSKRQQRAKLLGFKSHAHYVLEERMAEKPEHVNTFLNELLNSAKPAAMQQFNELKKFAETLGIDNIEKWDSAFVSEKLKKEKFNIDQEKLKPYFELNNVVAGVFEISSKLFGLNFTKLTNIDTYHSEVETYKVTDNNGDYKAILYTDFHPREGKRNGAWMTSFKNQWIKDGENSRPHISIVCNFTKPTKTTPSLLTFNEVTTLFHEFGHALHGMLANTKYPSLSGTSVYWDFVELPSQLLENWCYQKEALSLFAKHYKTGELLPMEYILKIKEAANFLEGIQTLRQLGFAMLDMSWHTQPINSKTDVKQFEESAFEKTALYPSIDANCMSTSFSHIFQGGYASGYYSYKWAEVLDADAFEYFKENGIFNKKIATKFKTEILEKGGTEKPMKLYIQFRGKKPSSKALLKRAGLH